jgi:hypothetical protein
MTNHLEWHQHAFIDDTNTIINVAVFEEWAHEHQLLEDIRIANNAEKVVCCCTFGLAGVGYVWDEDNKSWIIPVAEIPFDELS